MSTGYVYVFSVCSHPRTRTNELNMYSSATLACPVAGSCGMTRNNLYFQSAFHTASTPDANSYEIQGTERLSLAANSVSNNQTIRQHETTVSAEGHLANPVILTRCLPPCVTVAGDVRQEWFRGSSAYLRRGEILQRVRSSGVSVESCGADINGNEAALDTSACCCLTLMSHGFSNAEGQLAQNSSVPCSSGFAKDCWKHLCRGTCCLRCLSVASYRSFHCLLILFASLGVGCIISGLVLGILRMVVYGNFMVLSILFVGLGVLLIVIVVIGWRCTPVGREPCRRIFDGCISRSSNGEHRQAGSDQRDRVFDHNQWFGGVIYPEFRSRTPPPPYCSSMLESTNAYLLPPDIALYNQPEIIPATPPPAYRWQSITLLSHDISPPNYRLQDATGSVHGTSHASDNSSMASSFCDVTGVNDGGFVRNCAFDIHKIEFLHKLARFDGDDIVLPSQVTAVLDDCVAGSSSARDGGQTIDDEAGFVLVSSTTPALMSNSAREQQLPANVSDEE